MAAYVFVEHKKEFFKCLAHHMVPPSYEGFKSLYDDTVLKKTRRMERDATMSPLDLKQFQESLEGIPNWSNPLLRQECNRIKEKCQWLEKLIQASILSYAQLFCKTQEHQAEMRTAILTDFSCETFVHDYYLMAARELFKNPYLFDSRLSAVDQQRNMRDCFKLLKAALKQTIRQYVPMQDIVTRYMMTPVDTDVRCDMTADRKQAVKDLTDKYIAPIVDDLMTATEQHFLDVYGDTINPMWVQTSTVQPTPTRGQRLQAVTQNPPNMHFS